MSYPTIQNTVAKYIKNIPKFHSSFAADQAVGTAQLKVNPNIICGHFVNLLAKGYRITRGIAEIATNQV